MDSLHLYSQRQLSPFNGLVYIASLPTARAVSNDGLFWQIQVTCENQQHRSGLSQRAAAHRYVIWGAWSVQYGLRTMPLDPMLDVPDDSVIEQQLIPQLRDSLQRMPFRQRDLYELWILDSLDNLPMALIATRTDGQHLEQVKPAHWRASTHSKRDFKPVRTTTSDPLIKLEQLISDNTCCPIRSQWFLRDEDGHGLGLCSQNLGPDLCERKLDREKFPELLIRENWPNADARALAEEYHAWLAPRLLTLQTLSTGCRTRLEQAAQHHAIETSELLHLYPEIANQKIINRIQVEARLRQAAQQDQ